MSSLIVPELPSPTASTTTENLLGDIDEPSFVLFKSPIPTWKRRLRLVPWRLVLFLFTLLILIRPLDKKSAFRSSTAFEPSYFEVAIQRLDLSADLEAERVLKRKVDMPAVAETMQVDYSTVIIALLVVIIGMMIVRRSESKIETRAKRVAPRNAAPAVRASPKRAGAFTCS